MEGKNKREMENEKLEIGWRNNKREREREMAMTESDQKIIKIEGSVSSINALILRFSASEESARFMIKRKQNSVI